MTLEQALDETVKSVQNHLNSLQVALRNLAACEDQAVDDDEDFRQMVALEDEIADTVGALNELLSELPDIASDIRGPAPNPAMKAWHRTHKAERKLQLARRKEQAKAAAAAEKAAAEALPPGGPGPLVREMTGLAVTGPR
jgi:hypothetical protein